METIVHVDVSPMDGSFYRCSLTARDGLDLRPVVYQEASRRGWNLRELSRGKHTLEEIFVKVTKGEKEDELF
jgi:hypothetical protein